MQQLVLVTNVYLTIAKYGSMVRIIGLNSENSHMSAFTPEGLPFIPTEFTVPPLPQVTPDIRYQLFERMEQEVEQNPSLSHDQASWLLKVAFSSPTEASNLMNRFDRPGGFNGANAL